MVRISKRAAFLLDTQGFDKLVEALSKENREPALKKAMFTGARMVQENIRKAYKSAKPNSKLGDAIMFHAYPSYEGTVVRRFYVKGGVGMQFGKDSPLYRSYILNFLEKGASDRRTRGKGKVRRGMKYYNLSRGSIPALKFFQKGKNRGRNKIFKAIEKVLTEELAKQAMKA